MIDQDDPFCDDERDNEEDESDEPIGSCDECGINVYEDDMFGFANPNDILCGQCSWYLAVAAGEIKVRT